MTDDTAFVKRLVQKAVHAALEADMTEHLQAAKNERTTARLAYRSGYYPRKLNMKIGTIVLRVPQSRDGSFNTQVLKLSPLREGVGVNARGDVRARRIRGHAVRKVGRITEQLRGHGISATTISAMVATLDEDLTVFTSRRLDDVACHYDLEDARYEKVGEAGAIRTQTAKRNYYDQRNRSKHRGFR